MLVKAPPFQQQLLVCMSTADIRATDTPHSCMLLPLAQVWSWPNYEHLTTLSAHTVHHGRDGGVTAIALTRQDKEGKQ